MKTVIISLVTIGFIIVCVAMTTTKQTERSNVAVQTHPPLSDVTADDLKEWCSCTNPTGTATELRPIIPVDVALKDLNTCTKCQACINCYAWQLFIALNWPADPKNMGQPDTTKTGKDFGVPGDKSSVVWEDWKGVFDVFRDTPPDPWGVDQGGLRKISGEVKTTNNATRFEDIQSDHNWLTDVNGNIVLYEIMINEDEFQYIYQKKLYHQKGIFDACSKPPGECIDLPDQKSEFGDVGAIEVKASWMVVPDDKMDYYTKKYKLVDAEIPDEENPGNTKKATLALIGMHIIKKTPLSPQWIWATFEHEDNLPSLCEISSNVAMMHGGGSMTNTVLKDYYNLYDIKKGNPGPAPNYLNPPTKQNGVERSDPCQIVRMQNLDENYVTPLNAAIKDLIRKENPNSVWQYYLVVNTQWPRVPIWDFPNNKRLPYGNPVPKFLANTTMESYVQHTGSGGGAFNDKNSTPPFMMPPQDYNKSSCIGCHANSATTPNWNISGATTNDYWWTDYSSLFFKAQAH